MFAAAPQERRAGALAADKLAAITQQIESRGFAVVTDLVSTESCELLMQALLEDVNAVRATDKPTRHEKATGQGHLQLGLRRYAPFVRADLVANTIIEQIVAAVLGRGAWLGFYNGNVNLPGSVHQPLHFDRPYSWRTPAAAAAAGRSWPPPTTTLSCSVALADITLDNGATEIYPGSHLETAVAGWPMGERLSQHPELVEAWGAPDRMPIPAGGICFRDPRMWHRGVPNTSDLPRPMIALTYHAQACKHWRGRLVELTEEQFQQCESDTGLKLMDDGSLGDGRLLFEESAREVFGSPAAGDIADDPGVHHNVRFVERPRRVNHFVDAHMVGGARIVETQALDPMPDDPKPDHSKPTDQAS